MSTCNGARPEKFNYHVFAAYNEKNAPVVRLILEHLRNANLRVCDPASELIPGKDIFNKYLEDGIYKSKITLVFWSNAFKEDAYCLLQSKHAVLRASLTNVCHIVILVVIDNCEILERYEIFGRVDAQLWQENSSKVLQNVLQSVRAEVPDSTQETCEPCPAGQACTSPTNDATNCATAYFSLSGETSCTQCPKGSECPSTSSAPVTCAAVEYAAEGSTFCRQCPAGSECTAGGASACSAGYYSAAGDHLEVVEGPPQLHGQRASLVPCDHGLQSCSDNGVSAMNALNYPREMLMCSYQGCTFTAPKDSLLQHSRVCDYRKQRCDICGNNVTIKDMNWHKTVEDQMVECSDCGMFMPPSFKSSHDMWVCPNKQVFYRDCGSTLSEGQIEEHGIQNHTVSRIERELYSTSSLMLFRDVHYTEIERMGLPQLTSPEAQDAK